MYMGTPRQLVGGRAFRITVAVALPDLALRNRFAHRLQTLLHALAEPGAEKQGVVQEAKFVGPSAGNTRP